MLGIMCLSDKKHSLWRSLPKAVLVCFALHFHSFPRNHPPSRALAEESNTPYGQQSLAIRRFLLYTTLRENEWWRRSVFHEYQVKRHMDVKAITGTTAVMIGISIRPSLLYYYGFFSFSGRLCSFRFIDIDKQPPARRFDFNLGFCRACVSYFKGKNSLSGSDSKFSRAARST